MKFDLQQGHLDIHIDFERVSFLIIMTYDTGVSGKFKAYDFFTVVRGFGTSTCKVAPCPSSLWFAGYLRPKALEHHGRVY